jgi:hypothetical protein
MHKDIPVTTIIHDVVMILVHVNSTAFIPILFFNI